MTVTHWQYIQMKDSNVRTGWDAWTAFKFEDGSHVIVACQIPYDNIEKYVKAKGWRIGWKKNEKKIAFFNKTL
jgi:hypothetical protein